MIWAKNNKKQHNVFKDRSNRSHIQIINIDEVPFKIERHDTNLSLAKAIALENQAPYNFIKPYTGNNSFDSSDLNTFKGTLDSKIKREKSYNDIIGG